MDIEMFMQNLTDLKEITNGEVFVTFINKKGSKMGPVHIDKISQEMIEQASASQILIVLGETTSKEDANG